MKQAFEDYLTRYAELERAVLALVQQQGGPLCAECTCYCCDRIICDEAIESAFLKKLHGRAECFDAKNGFITPTGCMLEQGRPPTCYQYFCDNHYYYQPDEQHVDVLQKLGGLLNHVVREARGDIPLTDLTQDEEIAAVDFQQFEKQLDEGFRALRAIQIFYLEGTLDASAKEAIDRIQLVT